MFCQAGEAGGWASWRCMRRNSLAGQGPLQAPADLLVALALGSPAGHIQAGGRVLAQAGQRDHVQGAVELAVPSHG